MDGHSNRLSRFWREIKRRNVHRSLAVYAGSAYCFLEASTIIFPRWGFPDWAIDVLLYLLILGAVVTIFVSWVFDVTPEGIKKTRPVEEVPEEERIPVTNSWKIATYASLVVIIGLIVFNVFSRSRGSGELSDLENSIAVLPFENLFPDSSELWFTEGISDVISSQLTKISGYRLIDRKSTIKYKEEKRAIPEIGKELGVNYIILGTAQKQLNQIRIIVQLVRANNETQLWSEVYDREWKDFFDIQTDIATKIAGSLQTILTPEETRRLEDFGTESNEAYRLFMIGNNYMTNWIDGHFLKAADYYKQAIALDPGFDQAYARLASAYFELTMWDVPNPDTSFIRPARKFALKALELNKNLGEAYFVLGSIKYIHDHAFIEADEAFKKGMELSPDYVWGRISYANFLTCIGRLRESIEISRLSVKLDTLDPGTYNELGYAMAHNGQNQEALELYNKSLELSPNNENTMGCLNEFYQWEGTYNELLSDEVNTLLGPPPYDVPNIATDNLISAAGILASVHHRSEAYDILDEINQRVEKGESINKIYLGWIYNSLGEKDKALDLFEAAFDDNEFELWFNAGIKKDDPIRADQRFQDLLRKMGFIW